jgi:hypothetical protein
VVRKAQATLLCAASIGPSSTVRAIEASRVACQRIVKVLHTADSITLVTACCRHIRIFVFIFNYGCGGTKPSASLASGSASNYTRGAQKKRNVFRQCWQSTARLRHSQCCFIKISLVPGHILKCFWLLCISLARTWPTHGDMQTRHARVRLPGPHWCSLGQFAVQGPFLC